MNNIKPIAERKLSKTNDDTTNLVASPSTLRSLANTLRTNGHTYTIVRVTWKNFNPFWNGKRGLALNVSKEAYQSLFPRP